MINIIKLFEKILTFISLFNKELDMTTSSWTSGTCTVTNSSKYSVFIIIQNNEPIIATRYNNLIKGSSVSENYAVAFQATDNEEVWTLSYAKQVSPSSVSQSVTKIIGLIPFA